MQGSKRAGFTLFEVVISAVLFVIFSLGVTEAMRMARGSRQSVVATTTNNESMRSACNRLRDEWKFCSESGATITTLADGNHEVTFQHPIDVAGVPSWGIYEFSLGSDEASRTKDGWSIRYTVQNVDLGNGELEGQLVRQLLDETGALQRAEPLLDGLRAAGAATPGFAVVQAGEMWEITLATVGDEGGGPGRVGVFQVRALN